MALGAACLAPRARAAEAEDEEARLAFDLAVRGLTAYYAQGFLQERDGLVLQPEAEATFTVLRSGCLSAGLLGGLFGSLHEHATFIEDPDDLLDHFYDFTWWAGISCDVGKLSLATWFERSTSPSGAYDPYESWQLEVAFDDSGWAPDLSLQPWAALYVEITNSLDDLDPGVNLAFGIEPTRTFSGTRLGDLTLRFPITASLSLHDFYQDANGRDDVFGWFGFGVYLDVPLGCLPGGATLEVGATRMFFGRSLAEYNERSDDTVASVGLTFSF